MRQHMIVFGKRYMARGLKNGQYIQVLVGFMHAQHRERFVAPFEDHGRARERLGSQP